VKAVIPVNKVASNFLPELGISGALDFEPRFVEKLPKRGDIRSTPEAKSELHQLLRAGWLFNKWERLSSPSPDRVQQLKNSISKTQKLLRGLTKFDHTRNIEADRVAGNFKQTRYVECDEATDATMVNINVHQVLERLQRRLDLYAPKKKPGRPIRQDYEEVIIRAALFFSEYSSAEATAHRSGAYFRFCKLFYEIVTGSSCRDYALESQIKAQLKNPYLRRLRERAAQRRGTEERAAVEI
jgi:hypothetical protein